ncbi:P22 phage major capsid protein family protein [Agromyces aureus]|uniref:Major capsid protein n=1 Tax=Agromyces aureus TaxID=453304 RepID=A0A191WF58_9MICO|nr:P22 phage major capsid protein family protein [Agromyces aureus]ANJ26814.1 hypothetical protein ATC03_08880 [Agromyces aureus]
MANIFQKATRLAGTALAILKREIKLPGIFTFKFGIADFKGAAGDTVMVKRPPLLRARDKGWRNSNAIVVDDLAQSKIAVKLDKFPYSAVHLSPEEATLDEVNYVRDIQNPQIQAISEFYEDVIGDTLAAADFVLEVNFTPTSPATAYNHDPATVALRARKLLNDARVPASGRYWLVGSSVSESIAGHPRLLAVDTSGLGEALRDGVVGKLADFTIIEVQGFDETESYFVHETAVALANVAPVVPRGATSGSSIQANGVAITQIFDYDSVYAKDRSIVESFVGAAPVLDPEVDASTNLILLDEAGEPVMAFYRAVKVTFGDQGTTQSNVWTTQVTGSPTGGSYTVTVDGQTTDAIAFNASNETIANEINELSSIAGVKVTGTTTKTLKFTEPVLVSATASLTGGSTPGVTVTKV